MVPSAAVILYPTAYIKVVVVKKCIVGFLVGVIGTTLRVNTHIFSRRTWVEPV